MRTAKIGPDLRLLSFTRHRTNFRLAEKFDRNTSFTENLLIFPYCSHGADEKGWTLTFVSAFTIWPDTVYAQSATLANPKWRLQAELRIDTTRPLPHKNFVADGVDIAPVKFSIVPANNLTSIFVFKILNS